MGKIFCLMGKSASGKDTIFKRILERKTVPLTTVVPGTTRPIRDGEKEGVEYYLDFVCSFGGYIGYPRCGSQICWYYALHGSVRFNGARVSRWIGCLRVDGCRSVEA